MVANFDEPLTLQNFKILPLRYITILNACEILRKLNFVPLTQHTNTSRPIPLPLATLSLPLLFNFQKSSQMASGIRVKGKRNSCHQVRMLVNIGN